jgi:hypothetical protein
MEKSKVKAIELIRRIREAHAKQLEGKTQAEKIAFYRAKAQQLNTRLQTPFPIRQEK